MMVSSRVIEIREKTPAGRAIVLFLAAVLFLFLAGTWIWQFLVAPQYYSMKIVANTKLFMENLGEMQKMYHQRKGRYAVNIDQLCEFAGSKTVLKAAVEGMFDPSFGLQIQADKNGYKFTGKARDRNRTLIMMTGP